MTPIVLERDAKVPSGYEVVKTTPDGKKIVLPKKKAEPEDDEEKLLAGLARVYVGPYVRPGDEGIERVKGHWRTFDPVAPELLPTKGYTNADFTPGTTYHVELDDPDAGPWSFDGEFRGSAIRMNKRERESGRFAEFKVGRDFRTVNLRTVTSVTPVGERLPRETPTHGITTRKAMVEHLDAEHPGWSGATTTAEHDPFAGPISRNEAFAAHREEHLAEGIGQRLPDLSDLGGRWPGPGGQPSAPKGLRHAVWTPEEQEKVEANLDIFVLPEHVPEDAPIEQKLDELAFVEEGTRYSIAKGQSDRAKSGFTDRGERNPYETAGPVERLQVRRSELAAERFKGIDTITLDELHTSARQIEVPYSTLRKALDRVGTKVARGKAEERDPAWEGFPFDPRKQEAPRSGDVAPERTADGNFVLYHGTSPEAAARIRSEGRLRPDDLRTVGVSTTAEDARIYGLMKSGPNAEVLRVEVTPEQLRQVVASHEIGGRGRNQFLLQSPERLKDWDGVEVKVAPDLDADAETRLVSGDTADDLLKKLDEYEVRYSSTQYSNLLIVEDHGREVAHLDFGASKDGALDIHAIYVDPTYRKKGIAVGMLAELHERFDRPLHHGSFSSPQGAQLGFFMSSHYPEWNKVWLGHDDLRHEPIWWEPGTEVTGEEATFLNPSPEVLRAVKRGLKGAPSPQLAERHEAQVFRSLKEAEDHVRERYGYADFTGMTDEDLPELSRVIAEVDRIADEFPQTKTGTVPVGYGGKTQPWRFAGIGTKEVAPPTIKERWGHTWGWTWNTREGPRIYLTTGEEFRQGTGNMGEIGFTFERTPSESIVHEMGHVMQNITKGSLDQWRYTNERIWPWTPKSKRGPKVSISKDLAIYADRDQEGFATLFSAMNTPGGLDRLKPAARRRVIAAAAEMNEAATSRAGKETRVV